MKETKINNKDVYYSIRNRKSEQGDYEGIYFYKIADKLFLKIGISSSLDNIDEVIKDFMKFDLK
mgnify:CR=1 FL=1